jgi:hypothetical protein
MKSSSTNKTKSPNAKALSVKALKNTEVWYQDPEDSNLWHGTHGVIVNTAALIEREFFYNIERVPFRGLKSSRRSSAATTYASA